MDTSKMKQTSMDDFITSSKMEKEKNRKDLKLAIDAIKCCGELGANLRNLDPDTNEEDGYDEEGCFVGLLQLIANSKTNTIQINLDDKVFSRKTQDAILEILHSLLRNEIVKRVNLSLYFSIFSEKINGDPDDLRVIFVRYLHKGDDSKLFVREGFLGFIKDEVDETCENKENKLAKAIDGYGLDLQKMRGYVHDYMDERSTVGVPVIEKIYSQALCTGNYKISATLIHLMLSSTFKPYAYRFYLILSDIGKYFRRTPNGSQYFLENLQNPTDREIGTRIMEKSANENHDFFSDVRQILSSSISTIDKLDEIGSYPNYRIERYGYRDWYNFNSVLPHSTSDDIITFEVVSMAFIFDSVVAHVTNISKELQKPVVDFVALMQLVEVAINGLAKACEESETTFKPIFEAICNLCVQHSIEKKLRSRVFLPNKDMDLNNADVGVLEKHIREIVYEKLLVAFIGQLNNRFNQRYRQTVLCQRLIPSFIDSAVGEADYCELLTPVLMLYEKDIQSKAATLDEIKKWRLYWLNVPNDERPKDVIQALRWIQDESHLNIKTLLEIFAILPMAHVSQDRMISDIPSAREHFRMWKRVRLDVLGLLYFHQDMINVDTDKVIQCLVDAGKLDFSV